jgi:hypothetical protein
MIQEWRTLRALAIRNWYMLDHSRQVVEFASARTL